MYACLLSSDREIVGFTTELTIGNLRVAANLAAVRPDRARQPKALAGVRKALRRLHRLPPAPLNDAVIALWQSTLHAIEGDAARALADARLATQGLRRMHKVYGMAAAYWEGWLEGGENGRRSCEQTLQLLRDKGWARPERAVAMLLPVFHLVPRGG